MKRPLKLLTISAALLASLALAACDSRNDQTAGQKLDKSVAEVKAGMQDAKEATKDAAVGVAGAAMDATITTKVNAALVADDQLKVLKINVDTKDGHVVLMGTAPDAVSRERATTLARAVDGVIDVDNRLAVNLKG